MLGSVDAWDRVGDNLRLNIEHVWAKVGLAVTKVLVEKF